MRDMYSMGVSWGNIRKILEAGERKVKEEFRGMAVKILLEIRQIGDDEISNPVVSRKIYSLLGQAVLVGMISDKFHDKVITYSFH